MKRIFGLLTATLLMAGSASLSPARAWVDRDIFYYTEGWYSCTIVRITFLGKDNKLHSYKWGEFC